MAANCRITRARMNLLDCFALNSPPLAMDISPKASAASVATITTTIRMERKLFIAQYRSVARALQ